MTVVVLNRALRQLRVSGMAATLEARILQAQTEKWPPIDVISALVQDELLRRQDRLLDRRILGRRLGWPVVGNSTSKRAANGWPMAWPEIHGGIRGSVS